MTCEYQDEGSFSHDSSESKCSSSAWKLLRYLKSATPQVEDSFE